MKRLAPTVRPPALLDTVRPPESRVRPSLSETFAIANDRTEESCDEPRRDSGVVPREPGGDPSSAWSEAFERWRNSPAGWARGYDDWMTQFG